MKSEIKPTVINERDSAESSNPSQESPQPKRLASRSFLRNLGMGAALLAPGAALLTGSGRILAARDEGRLTRGDVAILQLLAAAELIEGRSLAAIQGAWRSRRARFRVQGRT